MRLDRVIRIMMGLVLLSLVFVGPRTPLGWWGLFPLLTGILGGCPGSACATGGACATRPLERRGEPGAETEGAAPERLLGGP